MALLETIKNIAQGTENVGVPCAIMFGSVTVATPLTIRVDNRFDIAGEEIILTQEFRMGGVQNHTHVVPQHQTQPAEGHTHSVDLRSSLVGNSGGLTEGDKVVLLRNAGGQQFLVLGRV